MERAVRELLGCFVGLTAPPQPAPQAASQAASPSALSQTQPDAPVAGDAAHNPVAQFWSEVGARAASVLLPVLGAVRAGCAGLVPSIGVLERHWAT